MAALNQSKVKMWRRCQKQFSFRYDYPMYLGKGQGKELIPLKKKLPLYRGSYMHALQEALHCQWAGVDEFEITFGEGKHSIVIRGSTWEDVHQALADQFNGIFDEEKEELGDLPEDCLRMFKAYLRFWRDDQDRYEVATYEGEPMIEFPVEVSLSKYNVKSPFKGRLDLVVEDQEYGGLWNWDAKWVKSIPAPDERMMSPQALMYVWALRKKYDLDIRGFLFNYGRTKPPALPRVLKRGSLSVAAKMDTDYYTYLQCIRDLHGKDWKKWIPYYRPKLEDLKGREVLWFRRERIPTEDERILQALREFVVSGRQIERREKRRDYVPRSYFYNCRFGCDYHELCAAEFQGLRIEPLVSANYQFVGERYAEQVEDLLNG